MPSFKAGRKNPFSIWMPRVRKWGNAPDVKQPMDKEARARFFANVNAIAGIQ